jgi:hypothetical protein
VIAVLLVLALVFWAGLERPVAKAERVSCANNLRQVGIGFRLFAADNGDRFPMGVASNRVMATDWAPGFLRCFQAASNELATPRLLVCPLDNRKPATNFPSLNIQNVSYFLGLDADEGTPQMLLAGDRNLTTNGVPIGPGLVEISGQSVFGWTKALHNGNGNVVLSDGSVQGVTGARLSEMRTNWSRVYRLAVP